MKSVIVVSSNFDSVWPFAADHFHALWRDQGEVEFVRLTEGDERPVGDIVSEAGSVDRLACLSVSVTGACLEKFTELKEATFQGSYGSQIDEACGALLEARDVAVYRHPSEGFWGQSVSEFGLALTL